MTRLQITCKPLDAYFLGTDRNASHGDGSDNQLALKNPYFIRSGKLPAQSALFGILRYLGIQKPDVDFHLEPADIENIGTASYNLLNDRHEFGKIRSISPLMLMDEDQKRYIPVLRNRQPAKLVNDIGSFVPFDDFVAVESMDGRRYLPTQYQEKEAWDGAELLCLEDGHLCGNVFQTQVRVGINRQNQRKRDQETEVSGFFKKEYVILNEKFSFLFYADVEDDFLYQSSGVVYVGQGRTPFAVKVEETTAPKQVAIPPQCLPDSVKVNGTSTPVYYAAAISDIYYEGDVAELKRASSFMLADSRDYRVFTTNYDRQNHGKRYQKAEIGLKLIPAGSVFLFFSDAEMSAQERIKRFRALLEGKPSHSHARISGFNHLYFSDETLNREKEDVLCPQYSIN